MNITQIKYVLEVASSSSIREASTRLFVSQPAISTSIRELEEELGILIFERNNKGITLTDQGREFVTYAKKVAGQFAILEDHYLSKNADKERFSVSAQHYNIALLAFTETVKKFRPDKYVFTFFETRTAEVLENVRDLKSEVGVVSYSGATEVMIKKLIRDYQLEFTPLLRREAYVYVWKGNELAEREEVSIDELSDYPCVAFDQTDNSNFYLTEEAMADHNFEKMIVTDDRATAIEIIATLGGYAIGCGTLSEEDAVIRGLVSVKLKEEDPIIIGYVIRKNSVLSVYGQTYVNELDRYREI